MGEREQVTPLEDLPGPSVQSTQHTQGTCGCYVLHLNKRGAQNAKNQHEFGLLA